MRLLLSTAVLLGLVLIASASSRTSAQGQHLQAGITPGEKLSLAFDASAGGRPCAVIDVRGDFVGCRSEPQGIGRPALEQWYNLRLVARIDRPAPPQ
jgi:hypothetical protein